jgi:hypothetical protein
METAMLDGLESVRWDLEAQPPSNARDEVANALRALSVASPETSDKTYSRMLYALGNNHAGTYYPVALAVVPFLGAILREGGPEARLRALDVMIDLVGSFRPEPGFETVATSAGRRSLDDVLKSKVLGLAGLIEQRRRDAASPEEARLTQDLLALLCQ